MLYTIHKGGNLGNFSDLFFLESDCKLFNAHPHGDLGEPKTVTPPAIESFGLHGDRSDFKSDFLPVSDTCPAEFIEYNWHFRSHNFSQLDTRTSSILYFLAVDNSRKNRDVVIKLISKGYEGKTEQNILRLLNSVPFRTDPANITIPVLKFIELRDFCFAVMPYCDRCDSRTFECLDFAGQLLGVCAFLICFLVN